jgi:hypothetical protein
MKVQTTHKKELKKMKLKKALDSSFGAWKDGEHAELGGGIDRFVRLMSKSSSRRSEKNNIVYLCPYQFIMWPGRISKRRVMKTTGLCRVGGFVK